MLTLVYNQIKLKVEDEEKTDFITPYGVFCYQVMHFGLKKRGSYLPAYDAELPQAMDWPQRASLYWRCGHYHKR
jgi:hypothetical protein